MYKARKNDRKIDEQEREAIRKMQHELDKMIEARQAKPNERKNNLYPAN